MGDYCVGAIHELPLRRHRGSKSIIFKIPESLVKNPMPHTDSPRFALGAAGREGVRG